MALRVHQLRYQKIGKDLYVIQQKERGEIRKLNRTPGRRDSSLEKLISIRNTSAQSTGLAANHQRPSDRREKAAAPSPGVNVLAKGTATGTVTDIDGNYRLTIDDRSNHLGIFLRSATSRKRWGSTVELPSI